MKKSKKIEQQLKKNITVFITITVILIGAFISKNTLAVENEDNDTGKVIAHYIDKFNNEELNSEVIEGNIGEIIKTSSISIDNYVLIDVPETEYYMIQENEQHVYYYYLYYGEIVIHHIDEINKNELCAEFESGMEGYTFITHPREDLENYQLTKRPEIEEYKFSKQKQEVYYYYRKKGQIIVHYIDKFTGKELDKECFDGLEGDSVVTKAKNIENYRLCENEQEKEAKFTENGTNVYYYYSSVSGGVKVKHIDLVSGKVIEEQDFDGYEGQEYNFSPKEFYRYSFVKDSKNTSGIMGKDEIEINFYYIYNSIIKIHHIYGSYGGEEIEMISGNEGEHYSTSYKNNHIGEDGKIYQLDTSRIPTNSSGIFSKYDDEIIYYYIPQTGNVKIKYIDKATGENILEPEFISGYIGESYSITKKELLDYVLVGETENIEGVFNNSLKEIIFYYLRKTYITINYIDDKTGKILDSEKIYGTETSEFSIIPKEIENYRLLENKNPKTIHGVFTKDPITINYYYSQLLFNIKVSHNIEKVAINGVETKINGKLGKVEINSKIGKYNISIYYKIIVSNNMEVTGSTLITDYIPSGFIAALQNNPNWIINGNTATIYANDLAPGESREYTLILTNTNKSITGIIPNRVEIGNFLNEPFFEDMILKDNISKTNMIIGIQTGEEDNSEVEDEVEEIIIVIILFLVVICMAGSKA